MDISRSKEYEIGAQGHYWCEFSQPPLAGQPAACSVVGVSQRQLKAKNTMFKPLSNSARHSLIRLYPSFNSKRMMAYSVVGEDWGYGSRAPRGRAYCDLHNLHNLRTPSSPQAQMHECKCKGINLRPVPAFFVENIGGKEDEVTGTRCDVLVERLCVTISSCACL